MFRRPTRGLFSALTGSRIWTREYETQGKGVNALPVFTITITTQQITIAQLKALIDALVAQGVDINIIQKQ